MIAALLHPRRVLLRAVIITPLITIRAPIGAATPKIIARQTINRETQPMLPAMIVGAKIR